MKIDNTGKPLGASLTRTGESRASARSDTTEAPAPETKAGDSVKLGSSFGMGLQQLESSLANQPVVDETRVAEIRKAISEGRFSVRADAIADKLMASVKELLSNNPNSKQG